MFKCLSVAVFSIALGISVYIARGCFTTNVNIKEYKRKIENVWYSLIKPHAHERGRVP